MRGGSGRRSAVPATGAEDRLTPLQDLTAGAVAGGFSRCVVAPLDVVKIRFQIQNELGVERALGALRRAPSPASATATTATATATTRAQATQQLRYTSVWQALTTIARSEGALALYKGNVPATAMVMPYASIQFAAFYQYKQLANALVDRERNAQRFLGAWLSLLGGAVSGIAATLSTYPLDLLRTRMAAQGEPRVYRNLRDAALCIARDEGARGFYAGLSPTLVEIVPYIALQFFAYETLKSEWQRAARAVSVGADASGGGRNLQGERSAQILVAWQSFVVGALSGTFAKVSTLPLDNAKKRMQVQGQLGRAGAYRSAWHCCRSVFAREGVRGLFRGAAASVLKAAPASGVMFLAYETLKRRMLGSNASVRSTSLALSSSASSSSSSSSSI